MNRLKKVLGKNCRSVKIVRNQRFSNVFMDLMVGRKEGRKEGMPWEFDAIHGIRVTSDDGTGEDEELVLTRNMPRSLDVALVDGEFEHPTELFVETWIQWKEELIWPEPEQEHVTLYTVGEPGTVPMVGQSIPADCATAEQVWQEKRCSGSWGAEFMFLRFPVERLTGDDDNIATAIFVRGANGGITAISSDSYEHLPPEI